MLKYKTGLCPLCTDGKEKPLIAGKCHYHYWNEKRQKACNSFTEGNKATKIKQGLKNSSKNSRPIPAKPKPRQSPLKRKNRNGYRNSKFYRDCWNSRQVKTCDNCDSVLLRYSAAYISHILSKGAHPALATHPENWNLLCLTCHTLWEFGDKKSMKIYPPNLLLIEKLKREYYEK